MHDSRGREIPDPIPVEIPVQWRRPPTIQEQIKMFVRRELSQQSAEQGAETFEEADDFDVGDDYDPTSPYEEVFDVNDSHSDPGPDSKSASGSANGSTNGRILDADAASGSGERDPSSQVGTQQVPDSK